MENAMVQLQEIFSNLTGVLGIKMCMKVVQSHDCTIVQYMHLFRDKYKICIVCVPGY